MCVMVFYLCDLCAKVIIIVASQQLHPNVGFASVRIVDRVVSVIGYSIRREFIFSTKPTINLSKLCSSKFHIRYWPHAMPHS